MMKKFEGTWNIEPFNQATLDANFGFDQQRRQQHWMTGPVHAFQRREFPLQLMESES